MTHFLLYWAIVFEFASMVLFHSLIEFLIKALGFLLFLLQTLQYSCVWHCVFLILKKKMKLQRQTFDVILLEIWPDLLVSKIDNIELRPRSRDAVL